MENRILAGWKALKWAAAVAGVCLLPVTGLLAQATASFGSPADSSASEPGPKVTRPALYPRANYVWPFATGPNYGEVASDQWNQTGVLHTRVGSFDLKRGVPAFPSELRATNRLGQLAAQYFLLQVDPAAFSDGSFDAIKTSIESQGGAIVQQMPVAAFVARLTPASFASLQSARGIVALEPYHAAFKLSPAIGRAPLPNAEKALSTVYTLDASLFPGEDAAAVAIALGKMGANVLSTTPDVIRFDINRNRLAQVAGIDAIESIHEALPVYPHGEESSASVQTGKPKGGLGGIDLAYTTAGIDGSGNGISGTSKQILMILDSGIQVDAADLSDTRSAPGTVGALHRKVRLYTTAIGGGGDALGCDAPASGSFTHGHVVAGAALGAANRVPLGYGTPFVKTDTSGNVWKFDGVAPGALLIAYDAGLTPALLGCDDPANSGLNVGTVYTDNVLNSGSLGDAYSRGARISNFSWGSTNDVTYSTNSQRIDQFLFENLDAMVFVSAGNDGSDTDENFIPDPGTVNAPATSKSAVVVGASNTFAANGGSGNSRAFFSSVGPATAASQRVAPILMAPGTDTGTNGLQAEYACRTSDNDQTGTVECDISQGAGGTSFSSPAAAGAGLVVRDYFAQGFYPDGSASNSGNLADRVLNVSGALVKATLIASADWMNGVDANTGLPTNLPGGNLTRRFRFNNEQGYGRIQLNNILPLATYPDSPSGLAICDGGIAGGTCNLGGLSGTANPSTTETYTFAVADNTQELRVALAWVEDFGDALAKNIDLELVSPGGRTYWGNYFTDDNNKNNAVDAGENCDYASPTPWPPATVSLLDPSPWSIPTCANSIRDTQNPHEAIVLSPDPALNGTVNDPGTSGIDEAADNQIETGTWTLRVIGRAFAGSQPYAIVLGGPVSLGSSVRLQRVRPNGDLATGSFICNDKAQIDVNEVDEPADNALNNNVAEISSRVTVQVIDPGADLAFGTGDDVIRDSETGLTFTDVDGAGTGLRFTSNQLILTDGTAPDPGNGALDIRSGWQVRVSYQDKTSGSPDANKLRRVSSLLNCRTQIASGGVVLQRFGQDAFSLVSGGCEKDARGLFTFGFPDNYMDANELIDYRIAFQSTETEDLEDVTVTLRPVNVDADSPADCTPDSSACADPNRLNNTANALLTVLDSPKVLGRIRAGNALSANFSVKVGAVIPANTTIEMVLGVAARKSGKPVESYAVSRHALDKDEVSFFYSTDFPGGGVEVRDVNNNENVEVATSSATDFDLDYKFENRTWSSLTATGRNGSLGAPWNFDSAASVAGFRSGLHNQTNSGVLATIAQWGEDRNFNNSLDTGEDRDPVNGALDQGWSTLGGCGWQTSNGLSRGVWHSGRINDTTSANCTFVANGAGRCQTYETYPGITGASSWWELLLTPEMQKVNQCATAGDCGGPIDLPKEPVYTVEFLNMAWNASVDFADELTALTWDLDTDTASVNPVDLLNGGVLNSLFGLYGARSTGNAPLTDGFPLFAPISKCLDSPTAGTKTCGGFLGGTVCTSDTPCTGNTLNGSVGTNRSGQNSCFFEGKTGGIANAGEPYGLAKPIDDDAANGWCGRLDGLNGVDRSKSCVVAGDCALAPYNNTCNKDDAVVDNYVLTNGPIRNMDITQVNGPDMRFTTLEDFYGDSGNSFQASLGFFVSEGTTSTVPVSSFGVAVDDLVVEWREYRLDADATPCAGGSAQCATINISQTNAFEGNALVRVTVQDATPYDLVNPVNDCNGDLDYVDVGIDDTDCNNNGTPDVTVKLSSPTETAGEVAVLDRSLADPNMYVVEYPISGSYNSPGVLFISRSGNDNPVVTAQYLDRNDGTGSPCGNAVDLTQRGIVQDSTTVLLVAGRISLRGVRLTDNGDNDGFADTNETVTMFVTVTNKTNQDLADLSANLISTDPNIECISGTTVRFTDPLNVNPALRVLPNKTARESLQGFVFKVANVNRPGTNPPNDRFLATFQMTVRSDKFDVGSRALPIVLELDLNTTAAGGTSAYSESFESGTRTNFLTFTSQSLDLTKASNALSNGYRCQYNDPDSLNSNDPGRATCFMGFPTASQNGYDWHIHDGSAQDASTGRAYVGTRSLHWGVHTTSAGKDTTRFSQLDAVRSANPINLPVTVSAELSFKHQVSLTDNRITNTTAGEAADRGVVAVQLSDSVGTALGNWIKIYPYENEYDAQGTDGFSNCTFDPIDDGHTEDSYFDPTDPFRRLGPSSTCFPEFVFASGGDTDYQKAPGDLTNIGRAFDGPGLKGQIDRGTWVEPKFLLNEFKGRRVRFRFLATSIEVFPSVTVNALFSNDNDPGDDGWYIDDVRVPQSLGAPVTLTIDAAANSGLPGCAACTAITPALAADPVSSPAPGQPVELDASASSADACPSGTLQFKFWNDANGDSIVGNAGDVLLRDWTDNPVYLDAPLATTRYAVQVRCSTATSCDTASNSSVTPVTVACPSTGSALGAAFNGAIGFTGKTSISWTTSQFHDAIRGDLNLLRSSTGNFTGTVLTCLANNITGTSVADATTPALGSGFYYLTRPGPGPLCNQLVGAWSALAPKEASGRDAEINVDANTCAP